MSFNLTSQFVRDHERLREQVESTASSKELKELARENERLKRSLDKKDEEHRKELADEAAKVLKAHEEKAELEQQIKRLAQLHTEAIGRKDAELTAAKSACSRQLQELSASLELELTARTKAIQDEASTKISAQQAEMTRLHLAETAKTHNRVASDIEGGLARLAYVPLGMRVSAGVLDALFVAVTTAIVRFGTSWGSASPAVVLILIAGVIYSLRAFFSPGNFILGISPAHIGPDHRPVGRPSIKARLICWLLHYGPLAATLLVLVLDVESNRRFQALLGGTADPGTALARLLADFSEPGGPGLATVMLALTFLWWDVLLVTLVFSRLLHRHTPYFWNTTLVEYVARVGFKRFALPMLQPAPGEVAG